MEFLFSTLQLLAALTILVFIHELGHFLAAKAFGMRVDKFFIFFDAWGKKLWSTTKGGTEYGIGWLPLGGYVKIYGMIDESLDKEQMNVEPGPNEFRSKPAWQRLVVMLAGIVFNVILGLIIFTMIYKVYETEYLPNEAVTTGVYAHELAREQGFETGDKIIAVNDKPIKRFRDTDGITTLIGSVVDIERNGQTQKVVVKDIPFEDFRKPFFSPNIKHTVKVEEVVDTLNAAKAGILVGDIIESVNGEEVFNFGYLTTMLSKHKGDNVNIALLRNEKPINITAAVNEEGRLGILSSEIANYRDFYEFKTYSLGEAFRYSMADGWETIYTNLKGFGRMARGEESVRKNVKSPIGMISFFPSEWNGRIFWKLTGLISFVLAFMNLLPIPALDGGHAIFLLWEMVTRRKPSESFMMKAQVAGMVLLLAFMVFALGNDIFNLVFGG